MGDVGDVLTVGGHGRKNVRRVSGGWRLANLGAGFGLDGEGQADKRWLLGGKTDDVYRLLVNKADDVAIFNLEGRVKCGKNGNKIPFGNGEINVG